ncbi:hypothetical protein BU23DRAFT_559798 [Bimuria novae-zelandiae CBS 107.79]|uniref:Uncharacterized protein n=1 Tax=Bimuria novae-zelandiae CBS 107.79 TaxID=1447943 RepID=A0A6A5UVM1_9PLEO|nr:hypothetical protein BU23DRAFT_559798 [Bimuria novae-zelandiae CBS 107.79]
MASQTTILSLGLLFLSVQSATAIPEDPTIVTKLNYGYGNGYQTGPAPSLLSIATPEPYHPHAPSYSNSTSRNCTKDTTTTVTISYPTASPSTSHTCHNTTITSTLFRQITTPSAAPSCHCTKSTTTITIPWPGTGTGYLPSGTGGAQPSSGNGTYHVPSLTTSALPTGTGGVMSSTSSFELEPETSSEAVQTTYGGDTPTSTPEPSGEAPSEDVPPAPPASSTGPEEPLFTGGAVKLGSGASVAVAVGVMVAWW